MPPIQRPLDMSELQEALESLMIDTTMLDTDKYLLQTKLNESLACIQDLDKLHKDTVTAEGGGLDPSKMPKWGAAGSASAGINIQEYFGGSQAFSMRELLMPVRGDAFFELRLTLQELAGRMAALMAAAPVARAIVQDPAMQLALLVECQGVMAAPGAGGALSDDSQEAQAAQAGSQRPRLDPSIRPLLQVRFMAATRASVNREQLDLVASWTKDKCITVAAAGLGEVLLLKEVLEYNAACMDAGYAQGVLRPGPCADQFCASFLVPLRPLAPAERTLRILVCMQCGQAPEDGCKLKVCSRCKTAKYCSAECQKLHWPTHKKKCVSDTVTSSAAGAASGSAADDGAAAAAGAERLKASAAGKVQKQGGSSGASGSTGGQARDSGAAGTSVAFDMHRDQPPHGALLNVHSAMSRGGMSTVEKGQAAAGASASHGAKRFIVKVQAPMTGSQQPLLVYDRQRSFTTMLAPAQKEAYTAALGMVRAKGLMGGLKLFMYASRDGDSALRLWMDDLPPQTQTW